MTKQASRTDSIDLLRGFIMMLMALDHASAMIGRMHFSEFWGVPFGGYPDLAWWLTRFLSHLCAPGFFFLMGMSIFLFAQKRLASTWSNRQIHRYFLKRGAVILLLMFFLEFPAWGISMALKTGAPSGATGMVGMPGLAGSYFLIPTSVLYGLGGCMMIAGFLWRLQSWQLLSITVGSFVLSWWYISYSNPSLAFHPLEHFLLVPGKSPGAMVIYPIIPWLGITTFGMFWAQLLQKVPASIYKMSLFTGSSFILAFIGLRLVEWGNFSIANNDSWISFFTLVKYPPSITFALITCGINLVLLALFSKLSKRKWLQPVKVFGQTAMFFYIAHLYLYAFMGAAFRSGCDIKIMYLCWLIGLIILYFICQRFLTFKKGKPNDSLWRMI
ncbi:DUF1624 domain-containing protein [Aureispira anguillae]|uniref:Heparan-alpha-glucosaminide N-acetyltransferase domain-containing protein n=1 Tax=Aureispira anguillae TaxID=2864201 RepID=A0A915YFM2_9BACT|nr:heparan-alpha-glucosaminide N-acetyltransferase domain-containing protein [Aureispira anguillae]BDS12157.1 heparan-alpha-glucosaminide N-acetyltransferase domain-containing protein [Aureispira anguillae]